MARRASHSSSNRRARSKKKTKSPLIYVAIAMSALAVIGVVVWLLTRNTGYRFQRSHLDKYIELTETTNQLGDGASIYVDMSDGMNFAYATPTSKSILQSVIDKLAANQAIKFYRLADGKISPLEMSHTQLYNYMLNSDNYNMQRAPVEATLTKIVESRQPALLMTDFEEYRGSVIEQAAYAKESFIKWLSMGYNITFYKWNFVENGKQKLMFLAVFDDNANRLKSLIETAVKMTDPNIETYVLGSRDFAYPLGAMYISQVQGGNYHNHEGKDVVTSVIEKGGPEDYIRYAKPFATADGEPGKFAPLDTSVGSLAEYYPCGVDWPGAIKNAKAMQETGVPEEDMYTHLLSKLYIDFKAQSGFDIHNVEVRVFDMQETMKAMVADSISVKDLDNIDKPEVNMVLTAGMQDAPQMPEGWKEIYVDFDEKFNGTFMGGIPATNLLRANIVVSKAVPEIDNAMSFFSWEGNQSLANSVKETLTSSASNPVGRILYTYYIRTLSE